MDFDDLHAALTDLAGTTIDDPGLLAAVRHRARRTRRRRVALTSGSALAVLGVALAAGEGGFSSGARPLVPASSPPMSTTTTTTSTTLPPTASPVPGECPPGNASMPDPTGPMILSWTGNPPAVGQTFDVTGAVTAVGSDTITVTLVSSGGVGGTLTVSAAHVPPLAQPGAAAEFSGTRTGPTTYQVTQAAIQALQSTTGSGDSAQGGVTSGPAANAGQPGGMILSWTGTPPAVGESFDVTGTVTAVGSDTLTVTLNSAGGVGGTLTVSAGHVPPLAQPGASAEFAGTRTGPDTYQLTHGEMSLGQSSGAASGSGQVSVSSGTAQTSMPPGRAILSWTGNPPAVGQTFDVTGPVTAVAADTVTVTLTSVGGVGGTVTFSALCDPPLARPGVSAHLSGTRTGPSTYQLRALDLTESAKTTTP